MNKFSYLEAIEFCSNHWYFNPQYIPSFESKYFELVNFEPRLPKKPEEAFKNDIEFFAFSSVFGEEFFTFSEMVDYCSKSVVKLKRKQGLEVFYYQLKKTESRLISNPAKKYAEEWNSWDALFCTQSVVLVSDYYSYQELQEICTRELKQANEQPKNLQKFFQTFKSRDKKIPKNPYSFYKKENFWVSWQDLFGLQTNDLVTFSCAESFCNYMYSSESVKPSDLAKYYLMLRDSYRNEISLPRHPDSFYSKTNEWTSYKSLFGAK